MKSLILTIFLLTAPLCLVHAHGGDDAKTHSRILTCTNGRLLYDDDNVEGEFDEKSTDNKSFTVTKGGTLDVAINVGTIRVETWDKNQVVVHVTSDEEGEEDNEDTGIRIRQKENTIRVTTSQRHAQWGEVNIDVSIPVQFNVQLATSAGDIAIEGKVIGTVEVQTSGGNISTGPIEGRAELETSGGDITTGDIEGDLTLNTSGGNIHVGVVTGTAEVQTLGGDIVIDRVDKALAAATSGGNVHVGDVGSEASVSTSGGDIILDHVGGNASLSTAGGNVVLTSAHGSVSASTAGGDIRADSVVGSINARTSSGNIDVMLVPVGLGKSKLSTSVGDLRLFIPENARASINARNRRQYWGSWGSYDEDVIISDYEEDSYDQDGRGKEVRAVYTLNGGGQTITLEASMGTISILKPDAHQHDFPRSKHKKKSKR